jgi:hypothetical protein
MNTPHKQTGRIALALAAALSVGTIAQSYAAAADADPKKPADAPAKTAEPAKPADAAKATGTVSGTVLGTDGKAAAAGVKIRLLTPENAKPRKQADAAAAKPGKVPAVAETEVGADGAFTLADVPAGEYVVIARLKGEGNARQPVTVAAGETVKVSLTLKAPAAAAAAAAAAK